MQIDKGSIDSMRFFSMGKELDDEKSLSDYPIPDPSHSMPVHVHLIISQTPRVDASCCGFCDII